MAEELKDPWVSERMKAVSLECSYEKRWQLFFFFPRVIELSGEDNSDRREDATSQLLEKRMDCDSEGNLQPPFVTTEECQDEN